MEEFFIVDNRKAWRKQPYISLDKEGGNYTWDVSKGERITREQMETRWIGMASWPRDKDRELMFVPCDIVEQLSFPEPAEGDTHHGHGPVLLRHPAVIERLRKASVHPVAEEAADQAQHA